MSNSILATDGYKFSMAQAGWPLRTETFYYSHRRGGPFYLPFDVEEMVRSLLPSRFELRGSGCTADHLYLDAKYHMDAGFWAAMKMAEDPKALTINALPKGSWFFDREPAFTITGPSALVSWLEPLVLQLNYRIQVATLAKLHPELVNDVLFTSQTVEAQRDITRETLDSIGVPCPKFVHPVPSKDWYWLQVRDRVRELIEIVEDPRRIFEVGMRGVTCMEQHEMALSACKAYGVNATSNVYLAAKLGMQPVGTMGHEHVQRYGNDEAAFRAMRERRPGPSSFLLDTYSTERSGIPAAYRLLAEDSSRGDSIRFDSGDKEHQFRTAWAEAQMQGLRPKYIMEDGFDAEKTAKFEAVRQELGVAPEDVSYGYGGYLVSPIPESSRIRDLNMNLTRSRVAAVYKLCQTGNTATMKFSDAPGGGKQSIPGKPVLYRNVAGPNRGFGFVHQEGEAAYPDTLPAHEVMLTTEEAIGCAARNAERNVSRTTPLAFIPSAETSNLISELLQMRNHYRQGHGGK